MGKGRYDAGNAPWEVFEREMAMAEEMPYPDEPKTKKGPEAADEMVAL